ncbi:MAG: GGDEF domain-containing response regulator [Lachnospiraceae bacterium]|nr:GGDEF domain-containing response regulator [Lachnospiraceae bacterium]
MMTNHILQTAFQTVAASSGEEAMALFEAENPDMVLSDLRMPGISGMDLQKKLQETCQRNIPFMFMTADDDHETEIKGFLSGAMDFIRKPFRADVLLRRVDNILQTVEKMNTLKHAASNDRLTGLLNKASSEEDIGFLCGNTPGALMVIDLDSFKLVNDLHGHAAGDRILIRFSDILRSAVRHDDLVGRIGGDEFVAFCRNITDEEVVAGKTAFINEQLIAAAEEILGEHMNIPLGASVGCVFAPDEGTDYHTLFKKADAALYATKKNGKHGYRVYRESERHEEKAELSATGLSDVLTLLGERDRKKGAMLLPLESFRLIFQFLTRMIVNYQRPVWLLQFTLEGDSENAAAQTDAFSEVLQLSLRQSDVVTKSGRSRVLVLLLELPPVDMQIVIDRIMNNWSENELSAACSIDYEMELLK